MYTRQVMISDEKTNYSTSSNVSLWAVNRIIIVPMVISLLFVFSLLMVQSRHQQARLAADRAKNHQSVPSQTAIPLITQPDLPTLSTTPDTTPVSETDSSMAPQKGSVGPSSADSAGFLQNVPKGHDKDGNDDLQATRKAMKLDELSL